MKQFLIITLALATLISAGCAATFPTARLNLDELAQTPTFEVPLPHYTDPINEATLNRAKNLKAGIGKDPLAVACWDWVVWSVVGRVLVAHGTEVFPSGLMWDPPTSPFYMATSGAYYYIDPEVYPKSYDLWDDIKAPE